MTELYEPGTVVVSTGDAIVFLSCDHGVGFAAYACARNGEVDLSPRPIDCSPTALDKLVWAA